MLSTLIFHCHVVDDAEKTKIKRKPSKRLGKNAAKKDDHRREADKASHKDEVHSISTSLARL